MTLDLSKIKDARIFIIEGIAGSGKDTIQNELSQYFQENGFLVYNFSEEELLFSWKHYWIKNMEMHRIRYLLSVLNYCEELIKEDIRNVVVLNRFHITYPIFSDYGKDAKRLYKRLVDRLKRLPVHIFIGKLSLGEIEERVRHSERKERIWRIHQQRRIERAGVKSLFELYKTEQEIVFKIAEKQGLPYSVFEIRR